MAAAMGTVAWFQRICGLLIIAAVVFVAVGALGHPGSRRAHACLHWRGRFDPGVRRVLAVVGSRDLRAMGDPRSRASPAEARLRTGIRRLG